MLVKNATLPHILTSYPDLIMCLGGGEAAGNTCSNSFDNYQKTSQSCIAEGKSDKAGTSGCSQSSLRIFTEQAYLPSNCFQAFSSCC